MNSYGPKTVTSNLALYLDAGSTKSYSGSGTTWTDISNNGRNGTLFTNGASGVATYVSGPPSYFQFDADKLQFVTGFSSNGFGLSGTAPACTICAWANLTRRGGVGTVNQYIAGFRNDSNFDFYIVLLDSNGATVNTEARLRTTGGLYDIAVNYINYFNNWTHIAFTASSTRTDLYLNGNFVGFNNASGTFGTTTTTFNIGTGGGAWISGRLAQVQVYTKTFTSSDVLQNYNATKARYGL